MPSGACSVTLLFLACLSLSRAAAGRGLDGAVAEGLEADDACSTSGEGHCDLSLLQLRGKGSEAVGSEDSTGDEVEGEANRTTYYKTLYHQTSPSAGHSILRTGFRRGSPRSWCGSAIYFSPSAHETNVKAVAGRGFMIEAVVNLGRVKHVGPFCEPEGRSMTEWKLKQQGYDSMKLDRGGIAECRHLRHCIEYIVYDKSRIVSMKGYPFHGTRHWWSPNAEAGELGAAPDGAEEEDDKIPEGLDINAVVDDCR